MATPGDVPPRPEGTQTHVTVHGPILPEIRILNPLDHLRVFFWVLGRPTTLARYKEQYGPEALDRIGVWLTLGFLWIPLTVPILGKLTGRVTMSDTVATIFMVALPLSAWFVYTRTDMAGAALGAMFYLIHTVDKSAADGETRLALVAHAGFVIAFSLPCVIALATTDNFWTIVAFLSISAGAGTWVAMHVGGEGFLLGFFAGLLVGVLLLPLYIEIALLIKRRYRAGRRSPIVPAILVLTLAAYGVLAWVYWFGGWSILHRAV